MGLRGLLVAKILGPHYLGIYSLFLLYQQYLLYTNIGVQYTLSVELSKQSNNINELKNYIGSTFFINFLSIIPLIIYFAFAYFINYKLFIDENNFFSIFLILNTLLFNFQDIFINIFRIQNKLYLIAFLELFSTIIIFSIVPFFTGLALVKIMVVISFILLVFTNLIFLIKLKGINFNLIYFKQIISLSIPFVLYHFFYSFFLMGLRSYIAYFYSYNIVGNFSFAYNIISIFLLLTNSITWIAYPKVISTLSNKSESGSNIISYLTYLIKKIFLLQLILSFFAFLVSPIFFQLFPQFELAKNIFYILLFSSMYVGILFPVITFHLSRENYWNLFYFSVISLLIGGIFIYIIKIFNLDLIWVVYAYLVSLAIYFNLVINGINKHFKLDNYNIKLIYSFSTQFLILLPSIFALFSFNLIAFFILLISVFAYYKDFLYFFKLFKNRNFEI